MAKRSKKRQRPQPVVGVSWYRAEQWADLRRVSVDAEGMEAEWDQWNRTAEARLEELQRSGVRVHKVEVDVDALVLWCEARRRPVNAEARAEFTSWLMAQGGGEVLETRPGNAHNEDGPGLCHYLGDRVLADGDLVEVKLTDGSWLRGAYVGQIYWEHDHEAQSSRRILMAFVRLSIVGGKEPKEIMLPARAMLRLAGVTSSRRGA